MNLATEKLTLGYLYAIHAQFGICTKLEDGMITGCEKEKDAESA